MTKLTRNSSTITHSNRRMMKRTIPVSSVPRFYFSDVKARSQSAFHWAMTTGWGLFALIHWFDVRGPMRSVAGPAVNTVPFAAFVVVGLLRLRTEGRRS